MKQNTKKKKFVVILSISILLLVGFSLLLYFYTDYPQRFPKWFSTYIPIITGAAIIIPIIGTLLSDIIIPIWDRLTEQDVADIAWLSNKAPIRKINYEDIVGRLGRGGKIPWVNRGILSRRALRSHGSVAIVGWMKSGKTREAAELIRTAVDMNLVSVIYEPTSALDLIESSSLEAAIQSEIDEHQKAIFFIDELGLRPEEERLSRLSTCIDTIKKVRPDTFFLITIQHERLTSVFETWLEQQDFHQVSLPPLTDDQREDLSLTSASELGVQLTEEAVDILVKKTDGRPYSILFTLQQAQSSDQLDGARINKLLEQTDEEAWSEQRRNITISLPIAKHLLTSIVHFSSAGVTPLESSIHRYAKYLAEKDQKKKIPRHSLNQAQSKWAVFDIVASKGLYTIPEPLLLPLIIDVDDARSRLIKFIEKYNPGWFVKIIQAFFTLLDSLAQIQENFSKKIKSFWKLLRKQVPTPLSEFFHKIKDFFGKTTPHRTKKRSSLLLMKIRKKISDFTAPLFKKINLFITSLEYRIFLSWSVDKAFLLSELGSELQKREFFTSQMLLNRGKQSLDRGDYGNAIDTLTKALVLDERKMKAYVWRGIAHRNTKKLNDALADFDRAIELDPDDAWAIAQRGVTYRYMKRYEDALKDFDRAIELDPDYAWAIAQRGITYREMKRYEEALADFDRAIELDPNRGWMMVERGSTYREMERYEEALADFDHAIELVPDFVAAMGNRGITYRSMGYFEKALAEFERLIELNSDDAHAIAHRGATYRMMERYEEAVADFDHAIELDPDNAWAIAQQGITYREMEHYEDSLANLDQAIEKKPDYVWAIGQRGITYRKMERYEDSLASLDQAIELDPDNTSIIAQRGITYRGMERYEEAVAEINRYLEIKLDSSEAIAYRGATYREMKRFEDALRDISRAIEIDPYDWYYYNRALVYKILEQESLAKKDIEVAIEKAQSKYNQKPDNRTNLFNLALYYLAAGDFEKSNEFYRANINNKIRKSNIRDAIKDLSEYLEMFPNHKFAQEMHDFLSKALQDGE